MNFEKFRNDFQQIEVIEFKNSIAKKPILSVCIQTYNQVKYISQCLDSILSQRTNFDFEILLGDDYSTDGTREICMSYAQQNPDKIRLFLHHRENNIKVNNNNTGLFNSLYNLYSSNGSYIAYCDGDDFWSDENKLQKQINFLEKNKNYAICYHDVITIDEEGNKISTSYLEQMRRDFNSDDLKKVLVQPPISTWCFRNLIKEIPVEMTKTINADNFWISLLGFYGDGKYIKDIKPSYYRVHSEGIWSSINREDQIMSKKNTYDILSDFYLKKGDKKLSRYFKKRSIQFFKMVLFSRLKSLNLLILKMPKYLKLKF